MEWTFKWLERPATRVIQFVRGDEVRGSISLDKDDRDDINLWHRLQEYLLDIQNDDVETHTRIN